MMCDDLISLGMCLSPMLRTIEAVPISTDSAVHSRRRHGNFYISRLVLDGRNWAKYIPLLQNETGSV